MKNCKIVIVLFTALLFGCFEDGNTYDIVVRKDLIDDTEAYLHVTLETLSFKAGVETQKLQIYSNQVWSITYPEWCMLSEENGTGDQIILVTVSENSSANERSGYLVITASGLQPIAILVKQAGKENEQRNPDHNDNMPPS